MTQEQADLLEHARESATAAQQLHELGHYGFAASRAYYAMFYVAQAFLLGKGLAFSKHSAVHAAFGKHFAKPGIVPQQFHRFLIRAMEVRHAGDYGPAKVVTAEEAAEQIARAQDFLQLADRLIGCAPDQHETRN